MERQRVEVPLRFLWRLSPPLWLCVPLFFHFFSLFPSVANSSSLLDLSDRSTIGKWHGYKDTQSHPQGEGSLYSGLLGAGFSLERLCVPFNCALFESLCMCGWIAWLLMFNCTPTHRIMFFCMFVSPVWLTTQNHSTLVTERSAVPFLPVNPEYSATRNQVKNTHRHTYLYITPCGGDNQRACISIQMGI